MAENRSPDELVAGVHRRIRMLDPQEGPFAGELVADGDEVRVVMDAAGCAGQPFWAFGGADHVAAPLDLVRRPDRTDVLLPWCTERISTFLGRRAAAQQALSTGECVTLAGSLLRGLVELDGSPLAGAWWLTDGGRPVFVLGAGESAAEGARALIARLRDGSADRSLERLLGDIGSGLSDLRAARRRMERWDAELTELAAPRPLQREVFAPAAAGDVVANRFSGGLDEPVDERRGWQMVIAERAVATIESTRRALRRVVPSGRGEREPAPERVPDRGTGKPGGTRRRPLLIGAAVATTVLAVGLLWPTGEGDEHASAQAAVKPAAETPVPKASNPAATAKPPRTDDPVAAAPGLVKQVERCLKEGDAVCADAVVAGSASAVLKAIESADAGDAVALVDSYGDIAVVRRGDPDGEQQVLVLLRRKDEWLVRDVYAVADQPGSS
ncbi:hypothetical protein DY023_10060 [Microbacterium bovistercoris]|uniref:Uncharacterized protein n=1 Tax=Microbacterium bovistercoris TaxID=2293570 RepID=A0A371NTH8_9MICO|nr:hypothetical protein [Microbacterium bovistercoris]REJ05566.1 hypothetical protein DY023_10060 [Microbacterium bovistercoris]